VCYNKKRTNSRRNKPKAEPNLKTYPSECVKCGKCPSDGVKFIWRDDVGKGGWRNQCTTCDYEKGYSKKSRDKQRAEDEKKYLDRNAATHLAWAHRNPDKIKEQQVLEETVPDRKFKALIVSAKQRDKEFLLEDSPAMREKIEKACDYCGFLPGAGEVLNGLDRVDNDVGYTDANTVPCCGACNFMKHCLHVDDFISASRKIFTNLQLSAVMPDVLRSRTRSLGGHKERDGKSKDRKANELTYDERLDIMSSPCYLCGSSPAFGVDRVDSNIHYTKENSKPCCWICNDMKKDLDIEVFKKHVSAIVSHTSARILSDTSNLPISHVGRDRQPIGVLDVEGERIEMVFPSFSVAEEMCKMSRQALLKAVETDGMCKRRKWVRAQPAQYRTQVLEKAIVLKIVGELTNKAS
jgi:hypothetical protein